jgi:hypothetical protein
MTENTLKPNNWLAAHARNVHSQNGEDGIIEEIFKIIPDQNNWCVEFGAWDGKHLSNTYNLIQNKGWSGVLIEGSKKRFNDLTNTYRGNNKAIGVNRMVDYEGKNSIESILSETKIPIDFDLISIDIDGNDYHIWNSITKYKPKVVVIEFNQTIPNDIEFIQEKNVSVQQGNSLLSLTKLGKAKGYELICAIGCNAFYVKKEYFPLFQIKDNSLDALFAAITAPRVFQMYDGTIMLTEKLPLYWQRSTLVKETDLQVIPKIFRFLDDGRSRTLLYYLKRIYFRMRFK